MNDFECQFDSSSLLTSDIVDIDDFLEPYEAEDVGLISTIPKSENASTDPMFQDNLTIHHLEEKVLSLKQLIEDKDDTDTVISEFKRHVTKMEKKLSSANERNMTKREEVEILKLALKMSVEDCNNIRFDLGYARDRDDKIRKGLRESLGTYFEIFTLNQEFSFRFVACRKQ